jgi:ubiquinone/menaquinone biosynthesis C-methylase UbiE
MLGEGDGRFLAAFVKRSPDATIDSVDCSREMMRVAARRLPVRDGVRLHHADARAFPLRSGTYDLVVTHFFLDCFSTEESSELISRIARAAAPRARWLISEFHQPARGLGRYWTGLVIRACYFGFRLLTGLETKQLPDYRGAMEANGFQRLRYELAHGGLLISELWERG